MAMPSFSLTTPPTSTTIIITMATGWTATVAMATVSSRRALCHVTVMTTPTNTTTTILIKTSAMGKTFSLLKLKVLQQNPSKADNLEPHILSIIVGCPVWRGCIDVNGKTIGTQKLVGYIEVSVIEGCPLMGFYCTM